MLCCRSSSPTRFEEEIEGGKEGLLAGKVAGRAWRKIKPWVSSPDGSENKKKKVPHNEFISSLR